MLDSGRAASTGKSLPSFAISIPSGRPAPLRPGALKALRIPAFVFPWYSRECSRNRFASPSTVVSVFCYGIVVAANRADNVVLSIADIVVICAVEVDGNDISGCIVAEPITLTVPSCSLDKPKPASATLVLPLACAVLFPVPFIAFACLFPALAGCLSWAAMNFQIIFKLTYFGLDF